MLPPQAYDAVMAQVAKDARFLQSCDIIDYSLLVGVHDRNISPRNRRSPTNRDSAAASPRTFKQLTVEQTPAEEDYFWNRKELCPMNTSEGRYLLFMGIIDTFTKFNLRKRGEFVIKRVFQGKGISCVPPADYADRFIAFMNSNVFGKKSIRLEYSIRDDTSKLFRNKSATPITGKKQADIESFTDAISNNK